MENSILDILPCMISMCIARLLEHINLRYTVNALSDAQLSIIITIKIDVFVNK